MFRADFCRIVVRHDTQVLRWQNPHGLKEGKNIYYDRMGGH